LTSTVDYIFLQCANLQYASRTHMQAKVGFSSAQLQLQQNQQQQKQHRQQPIAVYGKRV